MLRRGCGSPRSALAASPRARRRRRRRRRSRPRRCSPPGSRGRRCATSPGPEWWPGVPQFETPPLFRQPLPKQPRVVTSQWYVRPGRRHRDPDDALRVRGHPRARASARWSPRRTASRSTAARRPSGRITSSGRRATPARPSTLLCFERGPVAVEIKVLGETWSAAKRRPARAAGRREPEGAPRGQARRPAIRRASLARLPAGRRRAGHGARHGRDPGRGVGVERGRADAAAAPRQAEPRRQQVAPRPPLPAQRRDERDRPDALQLRERGGCDGLVRHARGGVVARKHRLPPPATGSHTLFRGSRTTTCSTSSPATRSPTRLLRPYGEKPSGGCVAALQEARRALVRTARPRLRLRGAMYGACSTKSDVAEDYRMLAAAGLGDAAARARACRLAEGDPRAGARGRAADPHLVARRRAGDGLGDAPGLVAHPRRARAAAPAALLAARGLGGRLAAGRWWRSCRTRRTGRSGGCSHCSGRHPRARRSAS